ncbi:MAG: hypothetical protein JWP07_51, partial [Pseudonocardiales bacterium]|nr:hypothetical protein [Pseudonocardiales bacterium]
MSIDHPGGLGTRAQHMTVRVGLG